MLIDADLLIYSVDEQSPFHRPASQWLTSVLNGDRRVGIPWQSIGAFLRIMTHPRITENPLTGTDAWAHVDGWLSADPSWIPPATETTARIFGSIAARISVTANLVPDAQLAALAIDYGQVIFSTDTDFGRFPDVRWTNPLR